MMNLLNIYKEKFPNQPMELQFCECNQDSRDLKVDEADKELINVFSSKKSFNQVRYAYFGVDSRYRTVKLASK